jgi:uracil phosphoribosyltransferase
MATMAMSLRVVVPPHPLIGHWLTLLRDQHTPQPLYATAMAELGRWLTYEAIRDWLPHRRVSVCSDLATSEGDVVDTSVPLLALPLLREGLGLWAGAQGVLPAARIAHPLLQAGDGVDGVPAPIDARCGVLVFCDQVATGQRVQRLLEALRQRGVEGKRLRLITALTASPGLKLLGEQFPELTLYTACIDAEVNAAGRIVPGIGVVADRLFGTPGLDAGGETA